MKIAVTIATKDGVHSVLYGPEVPFDEQKRRFRELNDDHGDGWDELQIITSANGRERRKRYRHYVPDIEPKKVAGDDNNKRKTNQKKGNG